MHTGVDLHIDTIFFYFLSIVGENWSEKKGEYLKKFWIDASLRLVKMLDNIKEDLYSLLLKEHDRLIVNFELFSLYYLQLQKLYEIKSFNCKATSIYSFKT